MISGFNSWVETILFRCKALKIRQLIVLKPTKFWDRQETDKSQFNSYKSNVLFIFCDPTCYWYYRMVEYTIWFKIFNNFWVARTLNLTMLWFKMWVEILPPKMDFSKSYRPEESNLDAEQNRVIIKSISNHGATDDPFFRIFAYLIN